jgi:hypothetical protein
VSPLVLRDACASSEGPGCGSGREGVRVRDDPQMRNDQITLLREENTLGGGNGRKFQPP